ncbi:hypothetical protein IC229_25050 [Spirosoma sp. BT702]|uniref:Uncharacterized protein n=2 Tax=Spirosoma profusum TaxID=2771354 RepID=A0A926Y3C9_9BACT|nr:hypothetical protein [Spirosoma profusum]
MTHFSDSFLMSVPARRLWGSLWLLLTTFSDDYSARRPSQYSIWLMRGIRMPLGLGLTPVVKAQNFVWANQMGGTSPNRGYSMAVDDTSTV